MCLNLCFLKLEDKQNDKLWLVLISHLETLSCFWILNFSNVVRIFERFWIDNHFLKHLFVNELSNKCFCCFCQQIVYYFWKSLRYQSLSLRNKQKDTSRIQKHSFGHSFKAVWDTHLGLFEKHNFCFQQSFLFSIVSTTALIIG